MLLSRSLRAKLTALLMPKFRDEAVAPSNSGDRLRELRDLMDESQREFAATLGVSEATYQRAERSGLPGTDLLSGLLRIGFSADWVLTGRGARSIEAIEELVAAFERDRSGAPSAHRLPNRASQVLVLPRLVDAYEAALERLKGPQDRKLDHFKLMELTVTLYDALTIGAEAVAAQEAASALPPPQPRVPLGAQHSPLHLPLSDDDG